LCKSETSTRNSTGATVANVEPVNDFTMTN